MNKISTRILTASALAAFVVLGSGCATTGQLDEVRAMAEEAKQAAAQAASNASAAGSKADAAAMKADEAMNAAGSAQKCCQANSEKMNRMFEKAMTK